MVRYPAVYHHHHHPHHQAQRVSDPSSMEIARHPIHSDMNSHHPPQHAQHAAVADASMMYHGNASMVNSSGNHHCKLPIVAVQQQHHTAATQTTAHPQHQEDQDQHKYNRNSAHTSTRQLPNHHQHQYRYHNNNNNHRPQLSPKFHSRSSPIVIKNPEDDANQAKLRWQHPMYDTSDDEGDIDGDDMGVSVETLTSPLSLDGGPRSSAPQSLPTALLRAPKLGSLPSQDYRLHHLASLPPPLSLNGEADLGMEASSSAAMAIETEQQTTSTTGIATNSYAEQKPKYLSSYGSLREAHLTGRYAPTQQIPPEYQKHVKFQDGGTGGELAGPDEPPSTLIPPPNPTPLDLNHLIPPQKKQPTKATKPMSIRDRMIQKAQQKKEEEEATGATDAKGEGKKAASSLSAMLANEDTNNNNANKNNNTDIGGGIYDQSRETSAPGAPKILPASMANAVAISYNSNLNLFASSTRSNRQQQQRRSSEQMHVARQGEAPTAMVLSSSMTGLEVLRAASRARPAVQRPTSLSILQASSSSASANTQIVPPATMHQEPPTFLQLSRTMSEPQSRYSQSQQHQHQHQRSNTSTSAFQLQQEVYTLTADSAAAMPRTGAVVRGTNGRALIPPQKATATLVVLQQPQQQPQARTPQQLAQERAISVIESLSFAVPTNPIRDMQSIPAQTNSQVEEPNPETEGAFDMDLE